MGPSKRQPRLYEFTEQAADLSSRSVDSTERTGVMSTNAEDNPWAMSTAELAERLGASHVETHESHAAAVRAAKRRLSANPQGGPE